MPVHAPRDLMKMLIRVRRQVIVDGVPSKHRKLSRFVLSAGRGYWRKRWQRSFFRNFARRPFGHMLFVCVCWSCLFSVQFVLS